MLTKKEFCEYIIYDFKRSEKVKSVTENDILKSSSLAVAMEYLGLIENKEMQDYAASRAGCQILFADKQEPKMLTTRELLNMLPDDINPQGRKVVF